MKAEEAVARYEADIVQSYGGSESMANIFVRQDLREAGGLLLRAADEAGLRPAAAAWIFDHGLEEWRFYIVSPLVGHVEKSQIYDAIADIMSGLQLPDDFSIIDIYLDGINGRIFRLIGHARDPRNQKRYVIDPYRGVLMQQQDTLSLELARIRWQAEGGLSGFRNLDMVDGYDCARLCLQGIVEALDRIDAAMLDAAPKP